MYQLFGPGHFILVENIKTRQIVIHEVQEADEERLRVDFLWYSKADGLPQQGGYTRLNNSTEAHQEYGRQQTIRTLERENWNTYTTGQLEQLDKMIFLFRAENRGVAL